MGESPRYPNLPVGTTNAPSSPGRAFAVFEISAHILEHTYERKKLDGPISNTKDLFALTRVNKSLSSIALAALWRVVYDPAPLFRLLPKSYVLLEPDGSRMLRMQNCENASITLHRYLYYTSLVHKLVLLSVPPEDAEALLAATMQAEHWKASNLHFPNLKSLCVPPASLLGISTCFAGIGLAVKDLTLMMQDNDSGLLVVQSLAGLKVDLNVLDIKDYPLSPTVFQQFVADALKTLKNITSLRIELLLGTLQDFFLVLHSLPRISEVHIHTVSSSSHNAASPLHRHPELTPKQINTLKGTFLLKDEMEAVIRISSEMLILFDRIYCGIRFASSPNEIEDAMQSIVRLHPLVEGVSYYENDFLTMQEVASTMPTLDRFHTTAKIVLPLIDLRHLRRLQFALYGTLAVTPELLDKLAEGCPSLESCYLSPGKRIPLGEEAHWLLTLTDVVRFALKPPQLASLGILFDARKRKNQAGKTLPHGTRTSLIALHVGSSAIDDALYVASIFCKYFPNLKLFRKSTNPIPVSQPARFHRKEKRSIGIES